MRATIFIVEKRKYYIFGKCLCRLRYRAYEYNAHASYCHL